PPTPTLFPYTTLFRSHPGSPTSTTPALAPLRKTPWQRPALLGPESWSRNIRPMPRQILSRLIPTAHPRTQPSLRPLPNSTAKTRSEEHTSELQSPYDL